MTSNVETGSRTAITDRPWPETGLEFLGRCPTCGNSERELVHRDLTDKVFFCASGKWNLFRCRGCGLGYLDPRPSQSTVGEAYASYYTHSKAGGLDRPVLSPWRRYRRAQRNAYLNAAFGYSIEPAARSRPRWLSTDRRQRFDKFVCCLPYPGPGARVLDIGCGNGRLLMQLRSVGWEVSGVEPDPRSAAEAIAAGLEVRSTLLENPWPGNYFDAVTMNHVIEHLHDPLATLRSCARLLKPGGVISIITPNFAGAGSRSFGRHWFALDPPRHLVLFTPESLRSALRIAGFETPPSGRVSLTAQAMFRRSMLIQEGSDPMRGRPPLPPIKRLKTAYLAWRANRKTRRAPDEGEELVVLARKPV